MNIAPNVKETGSNTSALKFSPRKMPAAQARSGSISKTLSGPKMQRESFK
jgi:hypothetical protein